MTGNTSDGSKPPGISVPSLEQKQLGRTQVEVSHRGARSPSSTIGAGASMFKKWITYFYIIP